MQSVTESSPSEPAIAPLSEKYIFAVNPYAPISSDAAPDDLPALTRVEIVVNKAGLWDQGDDVYDHFSGQSDLISQRMAAVGLWTDQVSEDSWDVLGLTSESEYENWVDDRIIPENPDSRDIGISPNQVRQALIDLEDPNFIHSPELEHGARPCE